VEAVPGKPPHVWRAAGIRRGWSPVVVKQVQRGLALFLMARSEEHAFDHKALQHLAAVNLPVTPTLDFLAEVGWIGEGDRDPWMPGSTIASVAFPARS
jgi:hypothetical protein